MGKVYVNQDALIITATTSQDITGALTKEIRYRKPDGVTGAFTAISSDDTNGVLAYSVSSGDLDQAGKWSFWAFVTFSDSRSAPGEPGIKDIYNPGY